MRITTLYMPMPPGWWHCRICHFQGCLVALSYQQQELALSCRIPAMQTTYEIDDTGFFTISRPFCIWRHPKPYLFPAAYFLMILSLSAFSYNLWIRMCRELICDLQTYSHTARGLISTFLRAVSESLQISPLNSLPSSCDSCYAKSSNSVLFSRFSGYGFQILSLAT